MEDQSMLDPLNEYHIWALHYNYVFIPRINKSLHTLFPNGTTIQSELLTFTFHNNYSCLAFYFYNTRTG